MKEIQKTTKLKLYLAGNIIDLSQQNFSKATLKLLTKI